MSEHSRPLKPNRFYVLMSLADEDRHGSDIMREALHLSEGHLRLWPTILYRTLDTLRQDGWIAELTDDDHRPPESRRRRYFRITSSGREALAAETERLSSLVETARRRNPLGKGETA